MLATVRNHPVAPSTFQGWFPVRPANAMPFGRYAGRAVQNARERGASYTQMLCRIGHAHVAQPFAQDFTGVRGVVHGCHFVYLLMIVLIIHQQSIAILKAESDAPVSIYRNCPMPCFPLCVKPLIMAAYCSDTLHTPTILTGKRREELH